MALKKKGGKKKFAYKKRSKEDVEKRANQSAYPDSDNYIKDDVKLFTPHDGDNLIRILPPTWDDATHFGIDVHLHYQVGANKNTYVCPEALNGDPCPICEEKRRAESEGDDDYAKDLKASKRTLVYIVDRDADGDGLEQLRVWPMSWTFDRDISALSIDRRSGEVLSVDNPSEGYDIEFTREGKGLNTKYIGLKVARRESELDNDDALEYAVETQVMDLLVVYDYDHLAAQVVGSSDGDGGKKRGKSDKKGKGSKSSDDEGEYKYNDVMDAEYDDLVDLVDNEELDVDPDDYNEDKPKQVRKFAAAVAAELGLEED